MLGDTRAISRLSQSCIALCMFGLCVGVGAGCKPSTPASTKTNNQPKTKTKETPKTPERTGLTPPVDPKPTIKPGQLPFAWSSAEGPTYTKNQTVLYVPRGYYEDQFGQEHVQLNYRPGQVTKFDKTQVYVAPLGKDDAPGQPLPHAMVLALPSKAEVNPGDMVLTWSRTKYPYLQRARVLTGGPSPKVEMVDLAISDTYTATQTIKPGTFLPIDHSKPLQLGSAVTWQDQDAMRHGIIIARSPEHVLVRGFGAEAFVVKPGQLQSVAQPSSIKAGDPVRVPLMNQYVEAKVIRTSPTHITVKISNRDITISVPRVDVMGSTS